MRVLSAAIQEAVRRSATPADVRSSAAAADAAMEIPHCSASHEDEMLWNKVERAAQCVGTGIDGQDKISK